MGRWTCVPWDRNNWNHFFCRKSWWFKGSRLRCTTATLGRNLRTGFATRYSGWFVLASALFTSAVAWIQWSVIQTHLWCWSEWHCRNSKTQEWKNSVVLVAKWAGVAPEDGDGQWAALEHEVVRWWMITYSCMLLVWPSQVELMQ